MIQVLCDACGKPVGKAGSAELSLVLYDAEGRIGRETNREYCKACVMLVTLPARRDPPDAPAVPLSGRRPPRKPRTP